MEKKSKTEITIEVDRTFIIRKRRTYAQVWCVSCREGRRMVSPEEVVYLYGISLRRIYRAVEAGQVHFVETLEGLILVCLKSLGIADNSSIQTVTNFDQPHAAPSLQLMSKAGKARDYEIVAYPDQQPSTGAAQIPPAQASENTSLPPARKRDWVLTPDALNGLLDCLDSNRESAAHKYETTRRKLIKYFECRGCLLPEDQADETINRVARRISEGKKIWTSDPASYFYGVARNVLREYWGAPEREFVPAACLPLSVHPYEDPLKLEDLERERLLEESMLESLDRCMKELPAESRELIIKYYEGEKGDKIRNRKNLAERLGIPPNALRIRVHRIRERLEKSVKDCLK